MKTLFAAALLLCATGCSDAGPSQQEFEALSADLRVAVAERDSLEARLDESADALARVDELEKQLAEVESRALDLAQSLQMREAAIVDLQSEMSALVESVERRDAAQLRVDPEK